MRLFVLGATGGTGSALTRQALERGHGVTAFVRAPDELSARHERLQVVGGDPRNPDELMRALGGHDAVLSTLGARSRAPTTLLGDAARSTLEAMGQTGLRRLVVVSSALLFPDGGALRRLFRFIFRNALADSLVMEGLVAAGDLDWTVVRPPRLTDAKPRGRYRVAAHFPPAGSIARADLARCMLDAVQERTHLGTVIGVSR